MGSRAGAPAAGLDDASNALPPVALHPLRADPQLAERRQRIADTLRDECRQWPVAYDSIDLSVPQHEWDAWNERLHNVINLKKRAARAITAARERAACSSAGNEVANAEPPAAAAAADLATAAAAPDAAPAANDEEALEDLHPDPRVRKAMLAFDEGEAKHVIDVCETCLEMRISPHDSALDIDNYSQRHCLQFKIWCCIEGRGRTNSNDSRRLCARCREQREAAPEPPTALEDAPPPR
jgi:hypothetical protein